MLVPDPEINMQPMVTDLEIQPNTTPSCEPLRKETDYSEGNPADTPQTTTINFLLLTLRDFLVSASAQKRRKDLWIQPK
jgi:hypothetical protein